MNIKANEIVNMASKGSENVCVPLEYNLPLHFFFYWFRNYNQINVDIVLNGSSGAILQ
jgi:hypothetical protein